MRTFETHAALTAVAASVFLTVAGCAGSTASLPKRYNYTSDIAKGLLYLPDGTVSEAALSVVLRSRFPPHSRVADFVTFVTTRSGNCEAGDVPDHLKCSIPEQSTGCYGSLLEFDVAHLGDEMVDLNARPVIWVC